MGVYVYTMRAARLEVDGLVIGNYKFAYKPWLGYSRDLPARFVRSMAAMDAAADRAKAKNEGVTLFTSGDLTPCPDHGGVPVYRIKHAGAAVYDSAFDRKPVGVLVKQGRAWKFKPNESFVEAPEMA